MLKVWGRSNSLNVQKVMWCVAELDLAHERIEAGGTFGKVREAWYLAMNPNGLVPVIDDNGVVLWESNAIVRYLAASHGQGWLWPEDPAARAQADKWMDWQATTLILPLGVIFWQLIRTPAEQRDPAAIETGRTRTAELFQMLDQALAGRRFIAGDSLTIGDIALGAAASRWLRLPIERPRLAELEAWHARLLERSGFRAHVEGVPLT